MAIEDLPQEISIDITEPEPMQLGQTLFQDSPYMWHVELYLMSKYQPEFVEATIFKVRAAALERAKIVKEDHTVFRSLAALQDAIESDLARNVTWQPQRSHRTAARVISPGIGENYQRSLDRL
jgi:hypothetical protein